MISDKSVPKRGSENAFFAVQAKFRGVCNDRNATKTRRGEVSLGKKTALLARIAPHNQILGGKRIVLIIFVLIAYLLQVIEKRKNVAPKS